MSVYLYPVLLVCIVGVIAGVMLTIAAKIMYVPVDERVEQITEALPGANCGGCGFAGCADYAGAIVNDGADMTACAVGGASCAAAIAAVMGAEVTEKEPVVANVGCSGFGEATSKLIEYKGIDSCKAAKTIYSGGGACLFGCIGLGDCVSACQFDAVRVVNGAAWVDRESCVGCGACAKACPNGIISLMPKKSLVYVGCSNTDKGAQTTKVCKVGCIGCKKCENTCKFDAIHVIDNNAVIDYEKCKNCGLCAKACPRDIITKLPKPPKK